MKAVNQIGEEYLSQLVAELNELAPDDDRQLEADHAAAYQMLRDPAISELDKKMIKEGADQWDGEIGKKWLREWRDYWRREGRSIGDLFRTLNRTGKLPANDLEELLDVCRSCVQFGQRSGVVDGKPFFEPILQFKADKDSYYDKAAYALVQLAGNPDFPYRVVHCKYCEKFKLVTLGKGRGRPRLNFCSNEHQAAFAQAKWRRNEAAKKAAKQRRDAAKRSAAKHR